MDGTVESVVLNYLSKKGFKNTENTFKQELGIQSLDELAFRVVSEGEASLANFLAFSTTTESERQYDDTYRRLRSWIDSSLDIFHLELAEILFPIFVHCYLDLVQKGFSDEARMFMNSHKDDHLATHTTDVIELCAVTAAHHITSNEKANIFRTHRYHCRLSSTAFRLLVSYLHAERFFLLLSIVNQHLDILVVEGEWVADDGFYSAGALVPETLDTIKAFNKTAIHWGALPELVPREPRDEEAEARKDVAVLLGLTPPSSEPEAKRSRDSETLLDAPSTSSASGLLIQAKADADSAPPFNRVPLPSVTEETNLKALEDLRSRVALSDTALPSIAMYTIFNGYGSVNAVAVSNDAATVAACLSDSVTVTWDLGKNVRGGSGSLASSGSTTKTRTLMAEPTEWIGHAGAVYSADFSPDSRFIVTASHDKTARLWSRDTGTNVVVYRGHNFPVWNVAFSPLGLYFATASHDRTARLWSTDVVHPLRVFAGHLLDVDVVRFHPNSNYVATGSEDKSVRLWDIQTGKCVRILVGHTGTVFSLAFSNDGRFLASSGKDTSIHVWDLAQGTLVTKMSGHTKTVWSLAYAHGSSSLLASASSDSSVRLWNAHESGGPRTGDGGGSSIPSSFVESAKHTSHLLKTFYTKDTPVHTVAFTPRNLVIAAGPFSPQTH